MSVGVAAGALAGIAFLCAFQSPRGHRSKYLIIGLVSLVVGLLSDWYE